MVITEKKTFFSWHLFFKLPSFLNHLSYRSLIGLKWKIISCSYWWHVSLSVSSSTCPFVGSSDHACPAIPWTLLAQARHRCPNAPTSKKALVPLLLLSCTHMRLRMSLGVMCLCLVQTTWDGTMFWYHDSMWWLWNQFFTQCFPNQQISLLFVYDDWQAIFHFFTS